MGDAGWVYDLCYLYLLVLYDDRLSVKGLRRLFRSNPRRAPSAASRQASWLRSYCSRRIMRWCPRRSASRRWRATSASLIIGIRAVGKAYLEAVEETFGADIDYA